MRVALKVAYDGRRFRGSQVQPDVRTVEGEVLRALAETGIASDREAARFQMASRTDAGVSALGNVVAMDTEYETSGILPALNAASEDVWFLGIATVPDDFRVRHAIRRWYRYHLSGTHDVATLAEVGRLFEGEHDFSAFVKDAPSPATQRVDAVDVEERGDLVILDFVAPRFLWHMVRRMVAAMTAVEEGTAKTEDVASSLRGGGPPFGLAAAEPLFLMEVDHGLQYTMDSASRGLLHRRLAALRVDADLTGELLQGLADASPE